MRSAFTYRDALRILGKSDSRVLNIIDRLLGGAILGSGLIGLDAVFALVDQKNEAMGMGRALVSKVKGRCRTAAGHSRHELLAAAHTTIAVTALFEEFRQVVGADVYEQLKLHDMEKVWVAAGQKEHQIEHIRVNISLLLDLDAPLPTPALSFESVVGEHLRTFYADACGRLSNFLAGLKDAGLITLREWRSLGTIPDRAIRRYREYYEQLANDVPEFRIWNALLSQSFVERSAVAHSRALARVEELLRAVVDHDPASEQERVLSALNSSFLQEPLAKVLQQLDDLSFPSVEAGYVTPAYRSAVAQRQSNIADPAFWRAIPQREDLEDFFVGYLSSPDAAAKPLVILGHPGAGKSMLTKVLAARLPTSLFMTAWVPLRRVDPEAPVHRQIEQAVDAFTNGRVSWLTLSEARRDVTRVVILDGFDELMQATGVVQSRYLEDLAEFQRKEQNIGRPISVVVTSRTVVADRARIPAGCVVLRLEDFDEARIGNWLTRWTATNASLFESGRYRPLTVESAKACAPLSSQPLLLMMIALYAANPAVPAPGGEDVTTGALYRSLIDEFVKRELVKDSHSDQIDDDMMAERWLSLGFTSFAMFNRGRLYIDERTLERDFEFLYDEKIGPDLTSLAEPWSRSHKTIGAFFFVHKSEAGRDDPHRTLRTYEFLHSTVGEFLIARTVYELMVDALSGWHRRPTVGGVRATGGAPGGEPGTLLTEILSCHAIAKQPAIAMFLSDLASLRPDDEKHTVVSYVRALMDHVYDNGVAIRYDFTVTNQVSRQATLLANLISITLALNGATAITAMFVNGDLTRWRSTVRLLRSGLDAESWLAFATAYTVTHTAAGIELIDQIDPVLEGPLYRSSFTQVADIAEHLLLGLSQAEMRLTTCGLRQVIEPHHTTPYLSDFLDKLAALLVYRNAQTDPVIYQRMAAQALAFPATVNDRLLETIPLVLDIASHDMFNAPDDVVASVSLLLDALRLRLSNFEEDDVSKWQGNSHEWLRERHREARGGSGVPH